LHVKTEKLADGTKTSSKSFLPNLKPSGEWKMYVKQVILDTYFYILQCKWRLWRDTVYGKCSITDTSFDYHLQKAGMIQKNPPKKPKQTTTTTTNQK